MRTGTYLAVSLVLAAVLAGCGGEPPPIPRAVISAPSATPAAGSTSLPVATPLPLVPQSPPLPVHCSPPSAEPADAQRGSNLHFSGECSFTETGRVTCSVQPDDFLFQFSRDTPNGLKLDVQLNVEHFQGSGTYVQTVQLFFEIPDNGTIYSWSTQTGSATIDAGARSGSLGTVSLAAEPGTPSHGVIVVTGTFACA